jgi:hypothetical protein
MGVITRGSNAASIGGATTRCNARNGPLTKQTAKRTSSYEPEVERSVRPGPNSPIVTLKECDFPSIDPFITWRSWAVATDARGLKLIRQPVEAMAFGTNNLDTTENIW